MQNTPKYIKQVPWYAQNNQGKGQTINTPSFLPKSPLNNWYNRSAKGYQSTSFRKGACQNCGAMGHIKKQCTQRPRKIGAKFTSQKIAPDDVIQNVILDKQAKKDRWNGFQPQMYKQIIEEHQVYEQIRKRNKINEGQDEVDIEFKKQSNPLEVANLPTKLSKNQKFTGLGNVRNRQDRAKYLLNLDLNGPHFDPKSRALKGQQVLQNIQTLGDKAALQDQISFASQQQQKHHAQISSIALPTLTEKIYKNLKQKNFSVNSGHLNQLSKKYDAQSGRLQTPQLVVYEQNDDFQINTFNKFRKQTTVRSKYEQNVFINDHISVWGSWYSRILGWGYSCCYSTQKMSYCLGQKGKQKALAKQLKIKAQKLREEQKLLQVEQKAQQQDQQK